MNPIELGKFIAQLRSEKELTQEELAEKLFIDKRKISRWECGTSTPEFDMLIKLSEIFDVSLYELSICQKLNDEKISKRVLNRFKNIGDYKNYKRKRIILIIILILLLAFFISTTIYTFKNYNTVEVYELESLDEDFHIEGNIIKLNNNYTLNVSYLFSKKIKIDDCHVELFNNNVRISNVTNNNYYNINTDTLQFHIKLNNTNIKGNILTINFSCKENNPPNYDFNIKINKTYDNRFF